MKTRLSVLLFALISAIFAQAADLRTNRFQARSIPQAKAWQHSARERLFTLMMGGGEPSRVQLAPQLLRRVEVPGRNYFLEEITLQALPDRRVHAWLARPVRPLGRVGGVLGLHGHGGTGEQIVRGDGLYWYGHAMIDMGYAVIAPDIGQHELQHTNWTLMGERTWDALRCLDHLVTLPEVDSNRLAVAGLSLGGETTMYVAALDERIRIACSSGWLTTVANMKNGHCPCFNFPGLEETFDFADIFACVVPQTLVCELGEQERAPGGFPIAIGREAMKEITAAYRVFNAETNAVLTVHPGPHVFSGSDFFPRLRAALRSDAPKLPNPAATVAWSRFVDAPETLDGTPYHWLGRTNLRLVFDIAPQPGDALELAWGAKGDRRDAEIRITGKVVNVEDGGHWGFRWVRLPVPAAIAGERYEIELRPGQSRPAFLSEIRLTRANGEQPPLDLRQPSRHATLSLFAAAAPPEAFPEMRKVWDREIPAITIVLKNPEQAGAFQKAARHALQANEALFRCRAFVNGWLAHADPDTGLIPRNLTVSRDFWNGRDAAADNYPYMVLTAAITDRSLLQGRLLDMLHTETKLTSRLDRLPDDYSFFRRGWRREMLDLEEIIFDGSEYVKDGLLPITEWLGPSPWSDRMIGIVDDVWKHATIDTPFGKIPTRNVEVCGDLLQANARLYWFTRDPKYLDWAIRLGDYFLLGTNHPTRDLKRLRLVDHGCEVINGLTELYVATAHAAPGKQNAYQKPLRELFDCILEKGRNPDGLLYSWFDPATGEHSVDLCDTWGYDYDGCYTLWLLDKDARYRDAVRQTLGNLKGRYVGACWGEKSADAYADSIEGALNLVNREPVASAMDWIDSQIRMMWDIQKADGVIEGWHGDGNFARTSLMYALWKTQGATIQPWRADVRFGAVREGDAIYLFLSADQPWEGRLLLDQPRHRTHMRLPLDYPRINQFPEWFTVEAAASYQVQLGTGEPLKVTGSQLSQGHALKIVPGESLLVRVHKR